MKSLEIVNKIQNDLNECFSRYDVSTMTIQKPDFYAKEWEQIKQDLEVLEIIKKKYVDIPLISLLRRDAYSRYYSENKVNEYILEKYNERLYLIPMCLTLEELIKIRKWMEGDENEVKKSN